MINAKLFIAAALLLALLSPNTSFLRATEYSSSNFILRDPVVVVEGGRSASGSFEYFSSAAQVVAGENTSASFIARSGFLFFPVASSSIVSAAAGNGQVSLSWTASVGTLANVTDYEVGTATVSGGPYSFESVGSGLSFVKTGLSNGTTYYFVVRSFANTLRLSESAQVSATPTAPAAPPPAGGGGGGAGVPITAVNFFGRAYPNSTVTLLKDAQVASVTIAGSDAKFQISLSGLSGGSYIFSIYGEDRQGIRSALLTFPISVAAGTTTNVSGIFIAPSLAVDKAEVKKGEDIAIFGQSSPQSEITIGVSSEEVFVKTTADQDGAYLYNFDTVDLELGNHSTRSKAAFLAEISAFGKVVSFLVGNKTVLAKPPTKCPAKADLNSDCRVNLVDFSIAAFWYKRPLSLAFRQIEAEKLNGDGAVTLVDFSIMAFYWTG